MSLLPPRSTRTYTVFPDTTLFRSTPGARPHVPGHDVEMGPARGWADEVLQEQRGDDRPGIGAARDVVEVRDLEQLMRLGQRSEEHTSELQSLMRISYAVFCLNKKTTHTYTTPRTKTKLRNNK